MKKAVYDLQTRETQVQDLTQQEIDERAAIAAKAVSDAASADLSAEAVEIGSPVVQTLIDAFHKITNDVRSLQSQNPVDRSVVEAWLVNQYKTNRQSG